MTLLKKVCIVIALFASQCLCFTTPPLLGPAVGSTCCRQGGAALLQLHVVPPPKYDNDESINHNNNNNSNPSTLLLLKKAKTFAASSMLTASLLLNHLHLVGVEPAMAAESRIVGQLQGSGLVFKDTLQIESFEDPKVKASLHLNNRSF